MENKSNIIAISGKQYSGKDTLAELLLKYMPDYKRIGIGDAIKIELAKKKNIELGEIYKNKHLYRNDLIELGNWGRSLAPDYWLKNLIVFERIIVPDLRMPFELDYLKNKGGILIRVEASIESRSKRGIIVNSNDDTETLLDNYKNWDFIIQNNSGIEELEQEAKKLANIILHKSC